MIGVKDLDNVLQKASDATETPPYVQRLRDPFRVLISTILSARTRDETTRQVSDALFSEIEDPADLCVMPSDRLQEIIRPIGFYRSKTQYLKQTACILLDEYESEVPDTMDALTALPGVGRKTANLVLSVAFNKPSICVDTHVHRVTNRWGLVKTSRPEKTEMALRKKVPKRLWKDLNEVIVPFGKEICTPVSPKCSSCPLDNCPRIDVTQSR